MVDRAKPRPDSPLTWDVLRKTELKIPRHRTEKSKVAQTARFEVVTDQADAPPVAKTRVVRGKGRGKAATWTLELSVDCGGLRRLPPPPVQTIQIDRKVLAQQPAPCLAPSIPQDDQRVSLMPRLRELPDPYLIRFGDLRYQPTTIFPPDGRQPYYDENYPWRCLVRITTPKGWAGSGVLIGPRHVLMASHSVDWTPGWLTVDVLYTNGSSLASANGLIAYAESKVGPGTIPDDQTDEDYAVIVLDQRLGDIYGWLGSRTYDSGWDNEVSVWQSIGYPQDWSGNGEIAAYQTNFFLDELGLDFGSARLLRSQTFDNWPGQSGSPVFGFWDTGPYVVGVVSGQTAEHNYISGGSLLPSLVNRARSDHP
jgi:V8-like Glu-specific endopeptidase